MAITAVVFNKWKHKGSSPDALDALTLKVTLHTATYTPNIDTHEFHSDLTNEVSNGSGYTTGGETLASLTSAIDTGADFAYLDAADVTWTTLTKTFRYAVLRDDTGVSGTSRLIGYIDFGADQSPAAINFVIQWAAIASGGLLKVA